MNAQEETKDNAKETGKQKKKSKGKGCLIALMIILVILVVGFGIGWSFLSKEHREAASLPLNAVDFSRLVDGVYVGEYEGGMYKWRANSVQVTVSSGEVTKIEPISGVVDQGNGSTQMLYDRVIKSQSLQVDTISGATLTSKAYLQAVENALIQAEKK
jgi:uncharacterized protein with FMN-binding domain